MKCLHKFLVICIIIFPGFSINSQAQVVYYVGNGGDWHDWDIYSYDIGTSTESQLTIDPAIDNHPVISHFDPTRIAWSANRDTEEFDIYVADVSDMEGTIARLTFDLFPGELDQGPYPDRHPHWHPNGQLIIFTSKNRLFEFEEKPTTTCSQPVIVKKFFEGMNVIKLNSAGDGVESYTPLDQVRWLLRNLWRIIPAKRMQAPRIIHTVRQGPRPNTAVFHNPSLVTNTICSHCSIRPIS